MQLMCGIAGLVDHSGGRSRDVLVRTASGMAATLRHRSPDDTGAWVDPDAGVALGHRRLSIIDLSEHGHQPMASASGRWYLTYNGEIYNFRSLLAELEGLGHRFRGHSDTEVALAAIEQWGVRGALERFNGMFAFALWDRRERQLILARDRLGEKPLYYGGDGARFAFASELKALREVPELALTVDRESLALYARYGYVPAPRSIYRGISKLGPGEMLTLD